MTGSRSEASTPSGPSDDATTVFGASLDNGRSGNGTVPRAKATDGHSPAAGEPTGPLRVGQAFGSRYHIIRVLGIGGMGAVYHAWDAELGMAVALKVIRPEATADPGAAREMERRFKQELVLARQVTHKNVVRIHDLGEISGIKYITMPYLDGSDLASTLKKNGKMPVPEALRIVRDVAAGLKAAHEAGIVHRDLKPANIMVLPDHAVIMDFGIARSSGRAVKDPSPSSGLPGGVASLSSAPAGATVAGTILGTVQYMAPEQARGQPIDQRADIYALGLIFSDMLLGKRHSTGAEGSAFEELKRRIEHAPPRVHTIDPSIPEAIDQLIARCVEPDPAARIASSADLVAELQRLDENGVPIPIKRVVRLPIVAAVVTLLLAASAGGWWYQRQFIPPAEHAPVSVLIADFRNTTRDATLDGVIEPTLRLALEGAGFISAYDRTSMFRMGVTAPETLDDALAKTIAVNQGLGVVVSGALAQEGRRYTVSLTAAQAVTGDVITTADETVSDKGEVLAATTRLASAVREALGDDTDDSTQRFAMDTLSATSVDVVRLYASGMEAMSNNRNAETRKRFQEVIALDPSFGLAYAGMAMILRNLDQAEEARRYATEALKHLERMTERERLRTRGIYYYVTDDYGACVKEYGDMLARYKADVTAHNNLALCSTKLRNMSAALDGMRRAVEILPQRALYRLNLALYAAYAGDFKTAAPEAQVALKLGSEKGPVAVAFAQLGLGQVPEAMETYRRLAGMNLALASSRSASGLADLAAFEGRFKEAERILEQGAADDVKSKELERAAAKFAALAHVRLMQRNTRGAIAAADTALEYSSAIKIRFLAARVYAQAGAIGEARDLAAGLGKDFRAEPQAYAKIIEGLLALQSGNGQAIKLLEESIALVDTWIGRFDLGRAYLQFGQFVQADSEFGRCINRRGEALSLFLDEEPTWAFLPQVYYYQGQVREKIGGGVEPFRTYLGIREKAGEDPLLPEVRAKVKTG